MNPLSATYVARDTFLHRLHPGVKVLLLIFYAVALFSCTAVWQVLAFLLLIALTTLLLGLPLKPRISLGSIVVMLIAVWYFEPLPTLLMQLALAIGKVMALNLMLALFNMTTRPRDLIAQLTSVKRTGQYLGPILFTISTIFAVTPTVERDIRKTIDVETLRRGAAPKAYSLSAWATILVILLSRVLRRAEALATAIADRGYSPSSPISFTNNWRIRWQDIAVALFLAIPAAVILLAI